MKKLLYLLMVLTVIGCSKDDDSNPTTGTPTATAATDVSSSTFLANWNSVSNATEYELQVATETSFANPVVTQTNLSGPTAVTQLNGNTEYFYRVSATNLNQNPSGYSNIISVITLPDAPVAIAGSDITQSSFQANWEAVTGVTEYVLYVSQDNFTSSPPEYVSGYDGITVNGTSHMVSGLDSNSFYYFRLESKVGTRISEPSNSEMIQTL